MSRDTKSELVQLRAKRMTRGPKEEEQYDLARIKDIASRYRERLGAEGSAHVVAISGGADSTYMTLQLLRRFPEREWLLFCTPTGDEYADMVAHWERLECIFKQPIERVRNRNMDFWIRFFNALPNWRSRWCARLLKIVPCHALLALLGDAYLYVGLRADEEEREGVIYGGAVQERYPLREWGVTRADVIGGLRNAGISIPKRTDCRMCFWQRIGEWYDLWVRDPAGFQAAVDHEHRTGRTLLSPGKFTNWPSDLKSMREEFIRGRIPRGTSTVQGELFSDDQTENSCRLCRL
jgi:hypothetical protein